MLIHINPCWNNSTKEWMYNGEQVYSFASDEIFILMTNYYEKSLIARAISLFDVGVASNTLGSISTGNFFEKVCLWLVPIAEKSITVSFFEEAESMVFQLPKMSYLPTDWKNSAKLKENILYQPRICNLESGDAFCVIPDGNGKWKLIVIQVTVGKSHPIRANGLVHIFKSFKSYIQKNIRSKYLLFILPKQGKLDHAQPLHTHKGNVITKVPTEAKNFRQCVFNYSISNDHDIACNEQNVSSNEMITNNDINSSTSNNKAIETVNGEIKRHQSDMNLYPQTLSKFTRLTRNKNLTTQSTVELKKNQ